MSACDQILVRTSLSSSNFVEVKVTRKPTPAEWKHMSNVLALLIEVALEDDPEIERLQRRFDAERALSEVTP